MADRSIRKALAHAARIVSVAAMVMAFAPGAPATAAEQVAVTHAQGTTTVPRIPKRVVVFDMASLDTLDALGVKVAGVPGGNLPGHLSKYASADTPKVGTLFEPNYEAVNALEPDLIIIGGRSAPKYKDLTRIAPTIDLTGDANDFMGSVTRNAETLGRIFGKETAVEGRLAALRRSIEELRATASTAGTGLLVLTTGSKISAYGPGSRFGILHAVFGVQSAADSLRASVHGQSVSSEFILKTDPDWLFVVDRDAGIGAGAAAAVLNNELVAQTRAWKQGKVVYLDPVRWYLVGGGLASVQAMVDQLSQALGKGG